MVLGIALLFIFLHQPCEPPKPSRPPRWAPGPLAGSKPLAPDPDLRPLTNSDLKGVLVLVLVFNQSFGQSSGQLVAIWPLSDESLALSRSARTRMSRSSSVARSVNGSRLSIHSALGRSIVLGLGLPVWIVRDYWLLRVTVLNCPWLHQVVVCRVCRAIVRDFSRSVGRSVGRSLVRSVSTSIGWCFWYRSRNHSPKRFKT